MDICTKWPNSNVDNCQFTPFKRGAHPHFAVSGVRAIVHGLDAIA
jgi:hypothetical protein